MPDYRSHFDKEDLRHLYQHADGCRFVIETGTGISTEYIAKALEPDAIFYTIDLCPPKQEDRVEGVIYLKGWSTRYEDFLRPGQKGFVRSRYSSFADDVAIRKGKEHFKGDDDFLRKVLFRHEELEVDFFFSDSGEHCGVPEWQIVKNRIKQGGKFAAHDIYHPKSKKNFQVAAAIEKSDKWRVLVKTSTKQGLLIAERL